MDKQKFIEVLQKGSESKLLKFIQGDGSFQIFRTHYLNLFDNVELIELSDLAKGIIEECNKIGALQLVNNFENFFNKESINGEKILAISGVIINRTIELTTDIKLTPFNAITDPLSKSIFIPKLDEIEKKLKQAVFKTKNNYSVKIANILEMYSTMNLLRSINYPKAALTITSSRSPIFITHGQNVQNESYEEILRIFCLLLTLIGKSSPTPYASWWLPTEWIPPFFNRTFIAFALDRINKSTYEYNLEEIKQVESLYPLFSKLNVKEQSRLVLALKNLSDSILEKNDSSKRIINLITASEIIFLNNQNCCLSKRLRVRAAWFLGIDENMRTDIRVLFKSLYKIRSKYVHGDINLQKINQQKLSEEINTGIQLVKDAIWKILMLGKIPEWDDSIVGSYEEE